MMCQWVDGSFVVVVVVHVDGTGVLCNLLCCVWGCSWQMLASAWQLDLLKIREKQDRELLCPVNVGLIQYPPLLTVHARQSKRGAMAIYLHLVGFFLVGLCFFVFWIIITVYYKWENSCIVWFRFQSFAVELISVIKYCCIESFLSSCLCVWFRISK